MATLQFQREQILKKLRDLDFKLKAMKERGLCDVMILKQLQDDHIRNTQLLHMIDQHLKLSINGKNRTAGEI